VFQLLGAQVVLTGIRPEIAQTLTGLGVSLQDLITRSSLQNGITFAINQRDTRAKRAGVH
jgi:rsbT co-antagonist protein RsbR